MSDKNPRFSRILLKLSGEALAGGKDMGIDTEVLDKMSLSIAHLRGLGVQVGIVVGQAKYNSHENPFSSRDLTVSNWD